jgi:hypothetical protein
MEKVDFTLKNVAENNLMTLDLIFEVLYSKLCLSFIGNIYGDDDHLDNIMVKYTKKGRHYKIKRRNTIYNFYMRNNFMIKYIDMERYSPVVNRNLYIRNINEDPWQYYIQKSNVKYLSDKDISELMLRNINKNNNDTVDKFCEFVHRHLPDRYRIMYPYETSNDFDEFYIDLDVEDPSKFLNTTPAKIQLDRPYKLPDTNLTGGHQSVQTVENKSERKIRFVLKQ